MRSSLSLYVLAAALLVFGHPTELPGRLIHPDGDPNFCLDVRGGVFENGTPVQIYRCNGTPAQVWNVNQEDTKIQLFGTKFCLAAGSMPGNSGVPTKIWQCDEVRQNWFHINDKFELTGPNYQCLDLKFGHHANGVTVQTYRCQDGNPNQVWTEGPRFRSTVGDVSRNWKAKSTLPPAGRYLHPNGDTEFCLDVSHKVLRNGTPVQIYECNGAVGQIWNLNEGGTRVQLFDTNFCLIPGSNPGAQTFIWNCDDPSVPNNWIHYKNKIAVPGLELCLDLRFGRHENRTPVETWWCKDGNTNQVWTEGSPFVAGAVNVNNQAGFTLHDLSMLLLGKLL